MSDKITHLTTDTFKAAVAISATPLLVDFWAPWCGPCKAIAPVLDELATEFDGKISIAKVNIDENEAIAAEFGIRAIPTMLLFKGGERDRADRRPSAEGGAQDQARRPALSAGSPQRSEEDPGGEERRVDAASLAVSPRSATSSAGVRRGLQAMRVREARGATAAAAGTTRRIRSPRKGRARPGRRRARRELRPCKAAARTGPRACACSRPRPSRRRDNCSRARMFAAKSPIETPARIA